MLRNGTSGALFFSFKVAVTLVCSSKKRLSSFERTPQVPLTLINALVPRSVGHVAHCSRIKTCLLYVRVLCAVTVFFCFKVALGLFKSIIGTWMISTAVTRVRRNSLFSFF
jgi:hypothetical protein